MSPMWIQGPKQLDHVLLLIQRAGLEEEQLGQCSVPIWDAGVTGSGHTCYATMSAPTARIVGASGVLVTTPEFIAFIPETQTQ